MRSASCKIAQTSPPRAAAATFKQGHSARGRLAWHPSPPRAAAATFKLSGKDAKLRLFMTGLSTASSGGYVQAAPFLRRPHCRGLRPLHREQRRLRSSSMPADVFTSSGTKPLHREQRRLRSSTMAASRTTSASYLSTASSGGYVQAARSCRSESRNTEPLHREQRRLRSGPRHLSSSLCRLHGASPPRAAAATFKLAFRRMNGV